MSVAFGCISGRWLSLLAGLVILTGSMITTSDVARADSANEWLSTAFPKASDSRADGQSRRRGSRKGVQVASLGDTYLPSPSRQSSLSGGGVRWVASSGCLNCTNRDCIRSCCLIGVTVGHYYNHWFSFALGNHIIHDLRGSAKSHPCFFITSSTM